MLEECNRDPYNAVIVLWNVGQTIDIDTGEFANRSYSHGHLYDSGGSGLLGMSNVVNHFMLPNFLSGPSRDMNVFGDSNPKNMVPSTKCGNMDFSTQPLSVPITMKLVFPI